MCAAQLEKLADQYVHDDLVPQIPTVCTTFKLQSGQGPWQYLAGDGAVGMA